MRGRKPKTVEQKRQEDLVPKVAARPQKPRQRQARRLMTIASAIRPNQTFAFVALVGVQ